jgi:hypothetical protein
MIVKAETKPAKSMISMVTKISIAITLFGTSSRRRGMGRGRERVRTATEAIPR